jgi:hypothetical protein
VPACDGVGGDQGVYSAARCGVDLVAFQILRLAIGPDLAQFQVAVVSFQALQFGFQGVVEGIIGSVGVGEDRVATLVGANDRLEYSYLRWDWRPAREKESRSATYLEPCGNGKHNTHQERSE